MAEAVGRPERPGAGALHPWLRADNIVVEFGRGRERVRAVDGVCLELQRGECVGLVGESGSGKSSLGKALLGLVPLSGGRVEFEGRAVSGLSGREWKRWRRKAQMVFQDPFGSLNPRLSVGGAVEEVLLVHGMRDPRSRRRRATELFEAVGLDASYLERYPHEFSGGQRQRIGMARALAVGPSLLVADEPVSALDVSVQVQILNLIADLRDRFSLTILFIAHDLAVVRYLCSSVYVMREGRIVESGGVNAVYESPGHPYTQSLLAAVPDIDRGLERRERNEVQPHPST